MTVLAVNKFYYLKGGAERYYFELASILEAKGDRVIPFSMSDPRNEPTPFAEYFVSAIDFRGSLDPWSRLTAAWRVVHSREARQKITRLIEKERPNVAHLHNYAHQISPSILRPLKERGVAVVHTLHDYKLLCPTYRLFREERICEECLGGAFINATRHRCNQGSWWASAANTVEMYLHRWMDTHERYVDLFVAPSRFLREKMIEGGFSPDRVVFLHYCLDLARYEPCYQPGDYLLFIGRLADEKGVDVLLEAVGRVPGVTLRVVGEGPMRGKLERQAEGIDGGRIEFLGYRGGEELKELISRSRLVVVPSIWYENSPLVIYESCALGKPVVGSKRGGIPELVEPGVTGELAEPGDAEDLARAITSLWSRDDLAEMGREARRRAEELFAPERHYQELQQIYRRAAACA